ncbi:MAG: hypothetical protein ACYSWP_22615 [Planctomycetota bacterium]
MDWRCIAEVFSQGIEAGSKDVAGNLHFLKTFFPGTNFRPKIKTEIRFGIVPFTAKNEKDTASGKQGIKIKAGIISNAEVWTLSLKEM